MRRLARIAMIAITTNSSIRVNPRFRLVFIAAVQCPAWQSYRTTKVNESGKPKQNARLETWRLRKTSLWESLPAKRNPRAFRFVRGARLVCRSVRLAIIGLNQLVRQQISLHFLAADVRKHMSIHFHARAEHLPALFDHFLPLSGVVDNIPIVKRQIVF